MYRKARIAAFAVTFCVAGSAYAVTFDSLDQNADDEISKQEFVDSKLFERWDNNDDGKLSEGETAQDWSELKDWDEDDSGYLDDDEFYDNAWSDWDVNDNDYLDDDEWDDASDYGWYDV